MKIILLQSRHEYDAYAPREDDGASLSQKEKRNHLRFL